MNGDIDPVEAEIETRLAGISEFLDGEAQGGANAKSISTNMREILVVGDVVYHSAGYRAQGPGSKVGSQAFVKLIGTPTPNSTVTNGYIRFVPANEVRVPIWQEKTKTIQTWIDVAYIAQTLEQLRHGTRYFFIAQFTSGHVYSDIHSRP